MAKRDKNEKDAQISNEENGAKVEETAENSGSGKSISGPYATLLSLASQISATLATGANISSNELCINVGETGFKDYSVKRITNTTPGIMVIDWVPSYGVVTQRDDAANLAIGEIASFIKSKINGNRTWENGDLLVYIAAFDSLLSLHYDLIRVYGCLNQYSPLNKYTPRSIVEALGYNFDDLLDNQEKLYFFLNQRAAELSKFAMPSTFTLYKDHLRFNSAIFADGDTVKAQRYIFRQAAYYSYELVDQVKGLTVIPSTMGKTFNDVKTLYSRMLGALRDSADVDRIKADIINAYGESSQRVVPIPPIDYMTATVKDDLILTTINNMQITPVTLDTCKVVDKGNNLFESKPGLDFFTSDSLINANKHAFYGNTNQLNFTSDTPSPDEVVAAMRMHPVVDMNSVKYKNQLDTETDGSFAPWMDCSYKLLYCGTEIPIKVTIYEMIPDGVNYGMCFEQTSSEATDSYVYAPYRDQFVTNCYSYDITQVLPTNELVKVNENTITHTPAYTFYKLIALSKFDWHPPVYLADSNLALTPGMYWRDGSDFIGGLLPDGSFIRIQSAPIYDVQNVAQVQTDTMEQIYTALLYAAFFGNM